MAAEESGILFNKKKKYNLGPIYTMCFHRSDFIYDLKVRS